MTAMKLTFAGHAVGQGFALDRAKAFGIREVLE